MSTCIFMPDGYVCFITHVIQLINGLCQQQFVVFSRSKRAQSSAIINQQDINTFVLLLRIWIGIYCSNLNKAV